MESLVLKGLPTCSAGWDNAVCSIAFNAYRAVFVINKKDSNMWCEFNGSLQDVIQNINTYFTVVVNKPPTKMEALIFDTDIGCYRFVMMDVEQ